MASKGNKALRKLSGNSLSTKELARSLGLVKKRPSSSNRERGQENKAKAGQRFAYLIVLDFESTCWKDKKLNYGPEIIEFPAVLLNTSSGVLESEFHMFVQPSEHWKLSEFCTELTGITQSQVDDAVPIGTCLMLFGRWLQETRDAKSIKFPCDLVQKKGQEQTMGIAGKLCTFVTWSDWDLGNCLKNECYRKQLRMPQPMRSWIDLRATYKNFYSRKPQGLAGALQDLGIQFTGREHSGLDDARNTARLAWRMISDGCLMQITKSLDGVEEKLWSDFLKTFSPPIQDDNSGQYEKSARVVAYGSDNNPVFENLNFLTPRTRISSKPGENEITVRKRKSTTLESFCSNAKITKIKQFPDLKGSILVSNERERIARENKTPQDNENSIVTPISHTATACAALSNANNEQDNMANKKMASQNFGCVVSTNNTITSLVSPITSLIKGSKDRRVSHLKGEKSNACKSGFKMRSGLVKQSVCHNQNLPLSCHNLRSSDDIGRKEESSYDQPCKASNIEPCTSNIPLFRLALNKSSLIDESTGEGLDKTLNPKASLFIKRTTVSTSGNETFALSYSPRTNNLIKTFTPHHVKTPPVSLPVNCFNGGRTTPPLCYCGRRTRRKSVINPGPNHGRTFYSCSANHGHCKSTLAVGQKSPKAGCNFFRWEVRL